MLNEFSKSFAWF